MALADVEYGVCDGAPEDRDVGQGYGVLGGEFHDEDVYRHEDASPAYAAARGDHQTERRVDEAVVVARVQGEELLVMPGFQLAEDAADHHVVVAAEDMAVALVFVVVVEEG